MNLIDLSTLTPDQLRILIFTVGGLIWSYLTYRVYNYVIRKEEEREEYEKKHTPPFVIERGQNGKRLRRR